MPILQYIKNGTQYYFLKKIRKFLYGILHFELLRKEANVVYFYISMARTQSKLTNSMIRTLKIIFTYVVGMKLGCRWCMHRPSEMIFFARV